MRRGRSFPIGIVTQAWPCTEVIYVLTRVHLHSPRFPTPRRALFTSNPMGSLRGHGELFHQNFGIVVILILPPEETITTPPLPPTSSPAPLNDLMDISPLPARAPFCTTIEITSPTPQATPLIESPDVRSPDDELMVESPTAMARQPSTSCLEAPRAYNE